MLCNPTTKITYVLPLSCFSCSGGRATAVQIGHTNGDNKNETEGVAKNPKNYGAD